MMQQGVVAVIHGAADGWRVAIGSRNGVRGIVKVLGTSRFARGDNDGLRDYLDEHRAADVIMVLPASRVICRMCALPNADPEQLEDALSLQAEAMLLGNTPEHRVGMAVLPHSLGETTRSGLIISWPESAEIETPDTGRPVHYAPDLAGVAALMNGQRPSEPILWLDRAKGTVATAITHANGIVLRGTREDGADSNTWARRVSQAMAESALSVGHTGPFVEELVARYEPMLRSMGEQSAVLMAPDEVLESAADRLDGFVPSSASWSDHGVAVGVLLAHFGPLTALTRLVDQPPEIKPSRIRTMAEKLSRPKTAAQVVVAVLLILAFAPLVMSGLRLAALNIRFGDIDARKREIDRAEQQVALYKSLDKQAWSMTKVLSDLVSNAPPGIDLQVIRAGQTEGSVTVSGLAKQRDDVEKGEPTELIVQMQKNLEETGIFTEVSYNWDEPNNFGNQLEFDLSAKINQPHRRARYDVERDFEQWELQERNAGLAPDESYEDRWIKEGRLPADATASATTTTDGGAQQPTDVARDTSDDSNGRADSGGAPTRSPVRNTGRSRFGNQGNPPGDADPLSDPINRSSSGVATLDVPKELTEAQIDAMSKADVQERLKRVAEAMSRARKAKDEELEAKMKAQFDLLMARLREAR